jgi:copper chaperone CopZ
MKFLTTVLFVALALTMVPMTASAEPKGPNPEVSQGDRDTAVVTKLKAEDGTVAVYAKGLCCSSCAIGIRKKVHSLAFVDQARFTDGVDLDAKTQLVTIAIKKGSTLDAKALAKAIEDAGYEPVHLYTLDSDKLVTQNLTATN